MNTIFRQNKQLNLPEKILALLPFSLFFPIGVMYVCIIVFFVAWLWEGDFTGKLRNVRNSAVLVPVVLLMVWIFFELLFFSSDNSRRLLSVIHYLILLFLLLFLSIGSGSWQQRAKKIFFLGAVYGASIYYLTHLGVMPEWRIFANYQYYGGNKSIALGIFHAIAAAWILNEAINQTTRKIRLIYFLSYVYIGIAILVFAMTRTGILLFFMLSGIVIIRNFKFNRQGLFLVVVAFVSLYSAWHFSPVARERTTITLNAVRDFYAGQMGTGQGNRLQFVKLTGEMILEKPVLGHGIGSWLQQYPERAKGLETSSMSTPHNDYLLYAAELGAIGLVLLLAVYVTLLRAAWKVGFERGMGLLLVTVAMLIGGLFNAILRDWKFGMPMMILLALTFVKDEETDVLNDQLDTV